MLDCDPYGDDTYMVEWDSSTQDQTTETDINNWDEDTSKTSIGIAAATASYARVDMAELKKPDSGFTLYYTDTDSLFYW